MPEIFGIAAIRTSTPSTDASQIQRHGSHPGRWRHLGAAAALLVTFSMGAGARPRVLPLSSHQGDVGAPRPIRGLVGTSVGDVIWSGRYLWVGTESGIARLDPAEGSGLNTGDWRTYTEFQGLGRGSVSTLAAVGDTVWVGTLTDTTIAGRQFPPQVGTGLAFSFDGGTSWGRVPNQSIFESGAPGFERGPPTPIDNAPFGLAIDGSTVWATFFAGSSVRSRDAGQTWERVLPDGADEIVYLSENDVAVNGYLILADSLARAGADSGLIADARAAADSLAAQNVLHRTFDVLAYDDTVWIGTSSGIARSFDGGASWTNLKTRLDANRLPLPGNIGGNWVVGIERQLLPTGGSVIWAGAQTTGEGQTNSISHSADNGDTWEFTGPPFAWNFAFTDNYVWAGTSEGLVSSEDGGLTWQEVEVRDSQSGERLLGTVPGLDTMPDGAGGSILWVGGDTGLARSEDEGETWRLLSFPLKTLSIDTGENIGIGGLVDSTLVSYAARSPFAPNRDETTRIVYSLGRDTDVSITIYDFASRRVRRLLDGQTRRGQLA